MIQTTKCPEKERRAVSNNKDVVIIKILAAIRSNRVLAAACYQISRGKRENGII
jgi:hypothetical protein